MKIQIKHRITLSVLFECEAESLKLALKLAIKSRADLSGANLYGADLSGANLYGADLSGANLYGADLSGANLYGADLSGADLYGADLSGADLSEANLYGADLSGADLYGADLSGANLYGANLYGAKNIVTFLGLKHFAFAWKYKKEIMIKIGCKCMSAKDWLKAKGGYKTIGKKESYSKAEIEAYGAWIKTANKLLKAQKERKVA